MNPPIILIGIGNEFRGDDGAGLFIVRALKAKGLNGVAVKEYSGEGMGLMDVWRDFKKVILFDAVSSEAEAGTIFRVEVPKETIPKEAFCCSTHTFSIADVIQMAQTLNRLPEKLIVYGVEGKTFEQGPGLSPEVKTAARKVVEQVAEEIHCA